MKKALFFRFAMLGLIVFQWSCGKKEPTDGIDLTGIAYAPKAYDPVKPSFYPAIESPSDNPMTVAGVQLGRKLFYDPILSADSTMSCASCHIPKGNFTDNLATSKGIDGIAGTRSTMVILDAAYVSKGLFWDGRAASLEEQALAPVENPIELHESWPNLVKKLQASEMYRKGFREAFGISKSTEITKELAAKAIAQFERILISSGKSKYDRFKFGGELDLFDDEEIDGMNIFFNGNLGQGASSLPDGECFHCHSPGYEGLTPNQFQNNGIEAVGSLDDFPDLGLGKITNKRSDNGKFRAPTLRNIELSAPYMHDGRFKTLEEVVDHYSSGGHYAENLNPFIHKLGRELGYQNGLFPNEKKALIKFLKTLTDTSFVKNPDIQNPF